MVRRPTSFLLLLPLFLLAFCPLNKIVSAGDCVDALALSSLNQNIQANNYTDVTVEQAKMMIDSNPLLIVLDVRYQYEYDSGHMRNAHLVPLDELPSRFGELDKNRDILVYCLTGDRSVIASQNLTASGFEHVYNMLGGITAWKNVDYPVYIRYSSLREALNNAGSGDTIRVSIGTYTENITINKPITLEGENKTATTINGNTTRYIMAIKANNINIQDFTIGNGYYAIYCSQTSRTNLTVQNTIIRDNKLAGITLYGTRHIVSNNTIINSNVGILLGGEGNNTITQNSITGSNQSGIELKNSRSNKVNENHLTNNSIGIRFYTQSNNNTIIKNIITNCANGISVHESSWNQITRNSIQNNTGIGISLLQGHNNTITKNDVSYNENKAFFIIDSYNNTLYQNNMINNAAQVDNRTSLNKWDNGFLEGNYWSDYNGIDLNGDGIGDYPYIINANNQDSYPLMSPYLDGDYNHDGTVNMTDVEIVKQAWMSIKGESNYNPHADFNMDKIISIKDATIIGVNWLKKWE